MAMYGNLNMTTGVANILESQGRRGSIAVIFESGRENKFNSVIVNDNR